MKSFFKKISELIRVIRFIKPQELRDRLDQLPTIQQFVVVLSGFTCLIVLVVILGFTIPTVVNIQMALNYQKLSAETTAVSRMEINLAELSLTGNELYSDLTPRATTTTFSAINKDLKKINPYLKHDSRRLIVTSISILRNLLSKPVNEQGYQNIQTEIKKITTYLDEAKAELQRLQASTVKVKLGLLVVLLSIITILTLLALFFWIRLTLQIVDKHLRGIQNFNRAASQFNEGQLNLIMPDHPNQDFRNLRAGFTGYIQSYKNQVHSIKTQVNEIVVPLKSLSNTIKQNNINYQDLKNKLQDVINNTYHKLDFVPDMANRIKGLNSDLTESQKKVNDIQEFMGSSVQIFETNLQTLESISTEFIQKDTFSKELIGYFRTLSKILDSTQHIVTVFGGIADQTTVLSLNASIEAARVGTTDDGFNVAASQIDELADRIRVIPHELTNMINKVRKKMDIVVRSYEHARFSFHKNPGVKYVDSIKTRLNLFWNDLNQDLMETQEIGVLIQIFAEKQKALEELTAFLAQLNRQIPTNYQKTTGTLQVADENQRIPELINRLIEVLVELNQTLDQI